MAKATVSHSAISAFVAAGFSEKYYFRFDRARHWYECLHAEEAFEKDEK
jgi:hypothetical protein